MNTPEPCAHCKHLYINALCKDDPAYMAECKLGLEIGELNCKMYEHWKEEAMKTPEMEEYLEEVANKTFGRSRKDPRCVVCGSEKVNPEDFNDDLSRREFTISRLCQKCQDKIFGY